MIKPYSLIVLIHISLLLISPSSWAAGNWQYYQNKAMDFYQQGAYAKAEKNAKYAIRIAKRADNGKAFNASSLNLLAFIQIANNQPDAALSSINSAIHFTQDIYDDEAPQVATLLFNKGDFLEQTGNAEQAIEAYSQALDIQRFEDLSDTASLQEALKTLHALTRLMNEEQKYEKVAHLIEGFMAEKTDTVNVVFNETLRQISYTLADAQAELKQPDKAQQTLKKEFSREENALEANDERMSETLERLAIILDDQGKQASAAPLREKALNIRSESGKPSLANVMNLNELALDSQQKQDYENAKELYQKALNGLKELGQDKGVEQALILGNFGSLEEAMKDKKAAQVLYHQSLALHERNLSQPLQAAYTAARAGAIFYSERDYPKAEPLFLQSLSWMEKAQAPTASKQIALENLIALYDAWNKNREKSKFLRQLKVLNE
ncbi:MAG: tetratricopeptide repeat protein [Marinomonas foliarum]|uniref:tetratricopeptide repeat protein n=1 Tax=Marinomonas foliarum TaxID=491950 RepID=UPI003F97B965